jgi:hypothetical protein
VFPAKISAGDALIPPEKQARFDLLKEGEKKWKYRIG